MKFDTIDLTNPLQRECLLELFSDKEVRNYLPQFDVHNNFLQFLHFLDMKEIKDKQRLVRYGNVYIGWISATNVMEQDEEMTELFYAVCKSKRGQGFGKMIIEHFIECYCDNNTKIKMEADMNNIYSQSVIESLGFEKYEEEIEANMYRYCYQPMKRRSNS